MRHEFGTSFSGQWPLPVRLARLAVVAGASWVGLGMCGCKDSSSSSRPVTTTAAPALAAETNGSATAAPASLPVVVEPQTITAPPAPAASIDQQISKARAAYEADAAQIGSIEAQVLSRLAIDVAYKTVTTEKDAAATQLEAAKKGDEDLALATHALSVTTQKEGELKAAALSADAGLAVARQRAQSDEDSLTALLQKQGIAVVAETQPVPAIAGNPSSAGSSSSGVYPPTRAGGKPTFVHSYTQKDGTFVPGQFSQ